MKKNGFFPFLAALVFFLFGLLTLSDYGVSWDSSNHFTRGQALVHYLLTGSKDYRDLSSEQLGKSSYQATTMPARRFFEQKYMAHPPLPDILATLSNIIFYQKLGWLADIESYHLFIVLVSSLLVWVVVRFTQELYGSFAAAAAALALVLYPLFLAEGHFNIKDPVLTAFYALTVYAFYKGLVRKSSSRLLLSAVACGFAFSTKWNIVFIPLVILPWLWLRKKKDFLKNKKILTSLVVFPLIVYIIFLIFDPLVWPNPLKRTWEIFKWYKKAGGSGSRNQPASFFFFGFNSYPLLTVLYTTPLVTLFLAGVGIITALFRFRREKDAPSFLILLWFLIPIFRVTVPGSSIYGGLRQIMEFVPAMAILAGLGASTIKEFVIKNLKFRIKTKKFYILHSTFYIAIILSFLPITLKMIQIHPNENVYFNPLIGGLKGAKEKRFPDWGDSLGNVYRQGVNWLNQNAEENAKVALLVSTRVVVPETYFRKDISYANSNWSRKERKGEYLMEAIYDDWIRVYYYAGEFGEKFLKPVHEIKVDGVPIFKIWENDPEHTYPKYLQEKIMDSKKIKWSQEENVILIELEEEVELMEVGLDYKGDGCLPSENTRVLLSHDGQKWMRLREPVREEYLIRPGKLIYPLTSQRGKYLKIRTNVRPPCIFQVKEVSISYL